MAQPSSPHSVYNQNMRYLDKIFDPEDIRTDVQVYSSSPMLSLIGYHAIDDNEKLRPVVIWLHAGGGHKEDPQPTSWCMEFALRGYVAVSIDYRGTGADFTPGEQKEAVSDAWACARWFRANAELLNIDPTKIFFGGNSAGGLTAVQANISANDMDNSYFANDPLVNKSNPDFPSVVTASTSLSGGVNTKFEEFIDPMDAPNYFYNGNQDTIFPIKRVRKSCQLMIDADIPSTLVAFEAGHKIGHFDEIVADLVSKFYSHL